MNTETKPSPIAPAAQSMREIINAFEKHLQGTAWEITAVNRGVATIDNGDLMLDVGMALHPRVNEWDTFRIFDDLASAEAFTPIKIQLLESSKFRIAEGDGEQLDADILQRLSNAVREVRRFQLKRLSVDAQHRLKVLGD